MNDTERVQTRVGVWAGALAAFVLLLASGAAYRIAAARLADVSGTIPLPRGTLAALPLTIGRWVGEDLPLSEAVVRVTDTDDYVHRVYQNRGGPGVVSLFLAYGVRFRDLAPHRPEVCYPGAGWTLEGTRTVNLPLEDRSVLSCQLHHFSRGGFDSGAMTVLNYYIVDGEYCRDVLLLRSLAWRFKTDARYVAQIQVACSSRELFGRPDEVVQAFAVDSAPVVQATLADAVNRAMPGDEASAN